MANFFSIPNRPMVRVAPAMVAWPPLTSVLAVLTLPLPSRKMWTQVPSAATQRPANALCVSDSGVFGPQAASSPTATARIPTAPALRSVLMIPSASMPELVWLHYRPSAGFSQGEPAAV